MFCKCFAWTNHFLPVYDERYTYIRAALFNYLLRAATHSIRCLKRVCKDEILKTNIVRFTKYPDESNYLTSMDSFCPCEIAPSVETRCCESLMASFSFDRRTCWKGQSQDSTHLWLDVSLCWPQTIKMELPWKLILLLSLVECVAGKHPPYKYVLFYVDSTVAINCCPGFGHNETVESGLTWKRSPLWR